MHLVLWPWLCCCPHLWIVVHAFWWYSSSEYHERETKHTIYSVTYDAVICKRARRPQKQWRLKMLDKVFCASWQKITKAYLKQTYLTCCYMFVRISWWWMLMIGTIVHPSLRSNIWYFYFLCLLIILVYVVPWTYFHVIKMTLWFWCFVAF